MIGSARGAAYRRFYLYSALSVAVIAIAVAAAILLHLGLESLGFGTRPAAGDASRNVSLSVALLAVAVPVGAIHLRFIARSLRDPAERASGIRDQYLNLWVASALLVSLFASQGAASFAVQQDRADVTIQVSAIAVAAIVGAIAAWWISRTPPESPRPRIRAAIVVMLVAMAIAAFSIAGAANGAGGMFQNARPPTLDFRTLTQHFQEQQFGSGLLTTGLALAVWAFGFAWQRRWAESRDRFAYGLIGYGLSMLVLLLGAALGIAGAIRYARDATQIFTFTTAWPSIGAGALLLAVHLVLLLLDRGRNGHPAVTTTRLLLAFPALVGLGMAVGGLAFAWHAVLERDAAPAAHVADDLTTAAALFGIGFAACAPSWFFFDARTTADSAVRRFYLFTVMCLGLVAGLVAAVVVVYEAISAIAGVGDADAVRTAATWALPAVLLAGIFAFHLRLLLGDQRQTRAPDAAEPVDPLVTLLEDVRARRVSVERAAATIRGPLA